MSSGSQRLGGVHGTTGSTPSVLSPQPVGDSPLFPMTSPFSSLATSALTSGEVDRILGTLDRGWNPAAGYLGSSVTMGAPTSSFVSQSPGLSQYPPRGASSGPFPRGALQGNGGVLGANKDVMTDRSPEEALLNLRYSKAPTSPEECLLLLRSSGGASKPPDPNAASQSFFQQRPVDPKWETQLRKKATKTQGALLSFMRTETQKQQPAAPAAPPSHHPPPSSSQPSAPSQAQQQYPPPSQPQLSSKDQLQEQIRRAQASTSDPLDSSSPHVQGQASGAAPPPSGTLDTALGYHTSSSFGMPPSSSGQGGGGYLGRSPLMTSTGRSGGHTSALLSAAAGGGGLPMHSALSSARGMLMDDGAAGMHGGGGGGGPPPPSRLPPQPMHHEPSSRDHMKQLSMLLEEREAAGGPQRSLGLDALSGALHRAPHLNTAAGSSTSSSSAASSMFPLPPPIPGFADRQNPLPTTNQLLGQPTGSLAPGVGSMGIGSLPSIPYLGGGSSEWDPTPSLQPADGRGRKRRLTETGLSGAQPASTTPAVPPVPLTIPNPLTGGRRAPGAPKLNLRDKILILEDQVRQATQLHRKLRLVSETLKQLVLARRAQDEEMDEARTRQLEMQNETLRHLLESVRKVPRSDTQAVLRLTEEVMSFLNQQVPITAPPQISQHQLSALGLPSF